MKQLSVILFLSLWFLASCSVNSSLVLYEEGSGNWETQIEQKSFFSDFFYEVFDRDPLMQSISESFKANPELGAVIVESDDNKIINNFYFNDLSTLPGLSDGIIKQTENRGIKTIEILLNRENWNKMENLIPLLNDPNIAFMGPQGSIGLTKDQFREMLLYPFDGYASSMKEASDALDMSMIHFQIEVPGTILTHEKGNLIEANRIEYSIPLFDLLMLDRELRYTLSYR